MLTLVLALLTAAPETVSLCLPRATWEFPKGGAVSEHEKATPVKVSAVQVDDRPVVAIDAKDGRVDSLALGAQHTVTVLGDGKPVASFSFRFTTAHRLTLRHKGFYGEGWSADDVPKACPAQP
jgi:hypothetical protein